MNRIGPLLSPFVKTLGIEGALRLEGIRREWAALIGEPLSLHMSPASLRDDELLISVDSPVWLQQISFYKKDVIEKLRPFNITEVRFRIGKIRPAKEIRKTLPLPPPGKALDKTALQFIEQTLSGVKDDGIRKGIRKLMEKAFSSKRSAL